MILKEITVTYARKQQTQKWCSIDLDCTVTCTPDSGESDALVALKAFEFARNHVLREMSGPFPSLKSKVDGLPLDLEGIQPIQLFHVLTDKSQQALIEEGHDPDRFVFILLPEFIEEIDSK